MKEGGPGAASRGDCLQAARPSSRNHDYDVYWTGVVHDCIHHDGHLWTNPLSFVEEGVLPGSPASRHLWERTQPTIFHQRPLISTSWGGGGNHIQLIQLMDRMACDFNTPPTYA